MVTVNTNTRRFRLRYHAQIARSAAILRKASSFLSSASDSDVGLGLGCISLPTSLAESSARSHGDVKEPVRSVQDSKDRSRPACSLAFISASLTAAICMCTPSTCLQTRATLATQRYKTQGEVSWTFQSSWSHMRMRASPPRHGRILFRPFKEPLLLATCALGARHEPLYLVYEHLKCLRHF